MLFCVRLRLLQMMVRVVLEERMDGRCGQWFPCDVRGGIAIEEAPFGR